MLVNERFNPALLLPIMTMVLTRRHFHRVQFEPHATAQLPATRS